MGYYGMPAAKLPPGARSPLDEALLQIKSLESLEVLSKLIRNAATQPKEEKYRRIRLSNPKIATSLVEQPGCMEALTDGMGWQVDPEDSEALVIPAGITMTMAVVRKIEDAKDRLQAEALRRRHPDPATQVSNSAAPAASAGVRVQA